MASEPPPPGDPAGPGAAPTPTRRRVRSPFTWIVVLVFAGVAFYLSSKAPKEQHVRFAVGAAAPRLTRLSCEYDGPEGPSRTAEFTYDHGEAPRVIAHDPELAPGEYVLHIRVFSKDGQNTLERRVTFSSGTVYVDLADAVPPASSAPAHP